MPLIRKGKNDVSIEYKLPKRKKNLLTKEFLQTFKQELDAVFNKKNDYEELDKRNYWNTYQYMEGTCGFYKALKIACAKHNLTKAIYDYACKMPYYDSDLFDDDIVLLMVEFGVIEEGTIEEIWDIDYENDKDFELIITEQKLKDCTIIHKDWLLTKECKDKLCIKDIV
ncbi:MAG: hypothetical protein K0R54_160 [Clostridiaceae bacterium]|jgi:hypothetical protein|nr:hypothetical protein [Clostridiaceae bacterium]